MTADEVSYLRDEVDRITSRRMPFGPYQGLELANICTRYLDRLLAWGRLHPALAEAIRTTLRRRAEAYRVDRRDQEAALGKWLGF